jgi:hypothetical protein
VTANNPKIAGIGFMGLLGYDLGWVGEGDHSGLGGVMLLPQGKIVA